MIVIITDMEINITWWSMARKDGLHGGVLWERIDIRSQRMYVSMHAFITCKYVGGMDGWNYICCMSSGWLDICMNDLCLCAHIYGCEYRYICTYGWIVRTYVCMYVRLYIGTYIHMYLSLKGHKLTYACMCHRRCIWDIVLTIFQPIPNCFILVFVCWSLLHVQLVSHSRPKSLRSPCKFQHQSQLVNGEIRSIPYQNGSLSTNGSPWNSQANTQYNYSSRTMASICKQGQWITTDSECK